MNACVTSPSMVNCSKMDGEQNGHAGPETNLSHDTIFMREDHKSQKRTKLILHPLHNPFFSHSHRMNTSRNHAPLTDHLPWSVYDPCCVLVQDTLESDGRFVLYQLAAQVLLPVQQDSMDPPTISKTRDSSSASQREISGSIYWLSASPYSESQIRGALEKMMAGASSSARLSTGSYAPQFSSARKEQDRSNRTKIRCLPLEIAKASEGECASNEDDAANNVDWRWQFLDRLVRDLQSWLDESRRQSTLPCWIIVDDVSSLGMFLGYRLVYSWIRSVHALCYQKDNGSTVCGLAVRASADADFELWRENQQQQQQHHQGDGTITLDVTKRLRHSAQPPQPDWVGAGGSRTLIAQQQMTMMIPWERALVELADVVVDVVPLTSGASREAHGRLTFTITHPTDDSRNGRWKSSVCNYCQTDNGVLAIRIDQHGIA